MTREKWCSLMMIGMGITIGSMMSISPLMRFIVAMFGIVMMIGSAIAVQWLDWIDDPLKWLYRGGETEAAKKHPDAKR